ELVDQALLGGVLPDQPRAGLVEHALHGLLHTLAEVAVAAVAQLHRLEGAGRGAAGHGGPAGGAVVEDDLDLDGGVAARVQDLARADSLDGRHSISLIGWSGDGRGERCATRGSLARVGGLLRADLGAE